MRSLLLIMAISGVAAIGCGKKGSDPAVVATPYQTCVNQTAWVSQRQCLVKNYRTEIDRCYLRATVLEQQLCAQNLQLSYGFQDDIFSSWRLGGTGYNRLTDPFYLPYNDYRRYYPTTSFAYDPWKLYATAYATNPTYYNKLYWTNYRW